jgi:hypothetical protein
MAAPDGSTTTPVNVALFNCAWSEAASRKERPNVRDLFITNTS